VVAASGRAVEADLQVDQDGTGAEPRYECRPPRIYGQAEAGIEGLERHAHLQSLGMSLATAMH